MSPKLRRIIKEFIFHTQLRRFFFHRYDYLFDPSQLSFLCQCIDATKHIEGAIAEIGCSTGATTVFLNKYMDGQNIQKEYFAIDTFSGFVAEDINFEITNRGKSKGIFNVLQVNKKKWFDETLRWNGVERVHSIETDVNEFDLTTLGALSFALLDVDLYRPSKKALHELYEVLSIDGIIVVDDCGSFDNRWDGSDQAYNEFIRENDLNAHIVYGRLGVIKKHAKDGKRSW